MRWKSKLLLLLIVVGLVAAVAVKVTRFSSAGGDADKAATTAPTDEAASDQSDVVATVQTATIRSGQFSQVIEAFGAVAAAPGAVVAYEVPAESRVTHLYVAAGEPVAKGAKLVDLEASADAKVEMLGARDTLAAAKKDLADIQQRIDLKLATNTELLQAQQAVQSAQLKLQDLEKRGITEGTRTITATADSLVSKIDVQEGQVVPAGNSLVELLPQDQVRIRLGVEPSVVGKFKRGDPVQLFVEGNDSTAISGKIRSIAEQVNPDTRLVDVFVTPDGQSEQGGIAPLLNSFVKAELTVQTQQAMVVPRNAVLPDDQGFTLFTVKDGHAVKHEVTVGLENPDEVAISGDGISAGDTVVVQGNLELDDGMAVTTGATK